MRVKIFPGVMIISGQKTGLATRMPLSDKQFLHLISRFFYLPILRFIIWGLQISGSLGYEEIPPMETHEFWIGLIMLAALLGLEGFLFCKMELKSCNYVQVIPIILVIDFFYMSPYRNSNPDMIFSLREGYALIANNMQICACVAVIAYTATCHIKKLIRYVKERKEINQAMKEREKSWAGFSLREDLPEEEG